ncbi:efflux RND transporter permease subunit [Ralstonia insidiosa]|uniref:Efflux pump membrane transporter n=1 Tax=Ralstonia insidiosa TaxID=190721 RepID=A0A848PBT2_9RALS|nr:efflux RND transporter permease subunit [Ralstonia insidiosa]NMV42144.1 efflux RND transporter permease subunit [Ralstonia insidiosa]
MARFFIDRPIFAWVVAIVIMLAGALSITSLPVSQYPTIALPSVVINATYPGASAKTVEDTVTQVIEQQMNGIDNLQYMASTSDSAGNVQITLTFTSAADPNIAQVQVQNKLQLATPLLPQVVQQLGISVAKANASFLMVLGVVSTDGSMDKSALGDYINSTMKDPISRLPGVGTVTVFGAPYAMRLWLDPNKLTSYQLTTNDVANAVQAQNADVSAGQLGGAPAVSGQQLNATITAQTRLQTAEQFRNVLLKVNPDGSKVLLGDVARVELGGQDYSILSRYNGKPAAGVGIQLATGANALATAQVVRDEVKTLSQYFPKGLEVVTPYDTTPVVKQSIEDVIKTLAEAIVLVFCVMYLFLQNFRATLIPTIAVPVVLLGTFGVLAAAGFSINTLTMFGMVLAIGLLVDDAIVVVENVERVMSEEGLPPKEATRKSMGQITGALVGIALVLSAVFIPMAFFSGSTGAIYRQFSITIVSAMVLSVLVAMILTPALCATLLKPIDKDHEAKKFALFRWFNRTLDNGTHRYTSGVQRLLKKPVRMMLVYAAIVGVLAVLFMRLPSAFLPDEDQGVMFAQIQLPTGATQEQTIEVLKQVEHYLLTDEKENVASVFTVAGFSFAGRGANMGVAFVMMKDWSQRKRADQKVQAVANRAMGAFSHIKGALAYAFVPPAVMELGNASGFDLQLKDQAGLGHEKLTEARNELLAMAAKSHDVMAVRPNGMDDTPQYKIDVDQAKAAALGLSLTDVNAVLSAAWGSQYINDFVDNGRVKKVYQQADAEFRMLPDDVNRWYVRNATGTMVPFGSFASGHWTYGSPRLERYNGVSSMEVLGMPAPGKSTGDAMAAMEAMIAKLPAGIGYEWTGLSFQEKLSGSQAPALYAISLLVVFLCLAALYESWAIPFSVMLVVPLGVLGAILAATGRGLSNDVYFQVGLLTTIGLSAKNAILIVEFAKEEHEAGKSLIDATLSAVRMRLRPILMTSIAFILGVLPLVFANGAGAGSQNAIGTGVAGGMLSATLLAIFFVPVFFVVVNRLFRIPDVPTQPNPPATPSGGTAATATPNAPAKGH